MKKNKIFKINMGVIIIYSRYNIYNNNNNNITNIKNKQVILKCENKVLRGYKHKF